MSFDSAIRLNQINESIDQIELQRRQILLSLDNIYGTLAYGDQQENKYASLVFILYDKLIHYWYNIPKPQIHKVQKNIDELELFLQNIADFD